MGKRDLVDAEPRPALGDSRSAVLNVLRAFGPLGVREAAERTGLHPNTVRFHLDGLVEAGLAERATEERARPGRPRTLYRAAATGQGVRSYRLLAQILTSLIAGTMPEPTKAATEAGRAWGRYLADRPAPFERVDARQALERLTGLLTDIGFGSQSETADGDVLIRLVHCPFRELAEEHRDVICPLHLGLIQGALAEMNAPLSAERLDPFVERHLCLAHLRRNDQEPDGEAAEDG
ncbi:MAG: helix-turn-helix domain-containing protein [Actinomadura rubrobrunea]|nr:helix-turn-helix domain-containing protein [Actinomadura rubrobrunea]